LASNDGLPVGRQIIDRPFVEATLPRADMRSTLPLLPFARVRLELKTTG
jgi:hypothetical protein